MSRVGRGAVLAGSLLAAGASASADPTLLDSATTGDVTSVGPIEAGGGALLVIASQDEVITRARIRLWSSDVDNDRVPDPTWDQNGDGILERGEPAAMAFVVLDFGPAPADLTTLDLARIATRPAQRLYVSPEPILLGAPPSGTLPAGFFDSGPVSIPFTAGHLYAVGFAGGRQPSITVTSADIASPPASLPPSSPGVPLRTIGRSVLIDTVEDAVAPIEAGPTTISLQLDGAPPGASGGGSGSGSGSGSSNADSDADGVSDDRDDCPQTYDPDQADRNHDGVGDACEAPAGCDAGGASTLELPAAVIALLLMRRRRTTRA